MNHTPKDEINVLYVMARDDGCIVTKEFLVRSPVLLKQNGHDIETICCQKNMQTFRWRQMHKMKIETIAIEISSL